MASTRFAPAKGAELAYRDEGSGPPVLLVHAGVADSRMWEGVVGALGGSRRTLRLDLRGFGDTRYRPGAYAPEEDLAAVLDAAGVARATAAGASFGGGVLLEAAARRPERFERLVLLAPALPDWDWSRDMEDLWDAEDAALERGDLGAAVRLNVERWARGLPADQQALVAEMQEKAFRLQLAAHAAPAEREWPPLDELDLRADVVVGAHDAEDFRAIASRLAETLPSASLHVLEGAGHLTALERPAAVAALL